MDLADRGDDIRVGTAAAEIAAHPLAYLVVRKLQCGSLLPEICGHVTGLAVLCLLHQSDRRAYLPRRAKSALKSVVLDKRRLNGVQLVAFCKALDCRDAFAFALGGQRQTAKNAAAVDDHRARSALAVIAAFFRAGQPEPFTQGVEQRHPRIKLKALFRTVDGERDGNGIFEGGRR